MFLNELAERRVVVIFCGRFQPFHRGHAIVYNNLVSTYGRNNVYIGTSGKVDPPKSPFKLSDRIYFMNLMGIPSDRILQLSNNYNPAVAAQALGIQDLSNTVMIFPVSQKDVDEKPSLFARGTNKDGSPAKLQPLPDDLSRVESADKHAYIQVVNVEPFEILGQSITGATSIRDLYSKADQAQRQQIIKDLYGKYTHEAEKIMNDNLLPAAAVEPAPLPNKTKLQKVAVPKEPVAESVVYEVGRFKDGYWIPLKQHATPTQAEFHAKNIKKKYPSIEVGIKTQDGQVNLVGLKEEAAGVGVIANKKQASDPRYKTSLTKDVRPGQIKKSLKAFNLAEEDLAWVRARLGESAVNALAARHIEYINQDIADIKQRISTEKLPADYVEKLKQKIANLEQERAKLAFNPA